MSEPFGFTLQVMAERLEGTLRYGEESLITGVASVQEAEPGDLVFAETARFLEIALRCRAAAVLTSPQVAGHLTAAPHPLILVENPRLSFVRALEMFQRPRQTPEGIHPTAQVHPDAVLGEGVAIGANSVVGAGAALGKGVILYSNVTVGEDCMIGDGTILHPNVVLYPNVILGRRCILHAGCVLGADGFGYIPVGPSLRKVPQLGIVEVGDEVEIGANACIDRAKTGATVIGSGTKIDNLVHVAHNVRIGMSSILVAQVGIAGSTTIGNGVILAGQAGLKDHVTVGDGARVLAQAGVIGDVAMGVTVSGYPARPHQEKMREYAAVASLPNYVKRIRALEDRLAELEARQTAQNG